MPRVFCCDDKYAEVVRILTERGWTRTALNYDEKKKAVLPKDAELVWTHLHSLHFDAVFSRVVNHMRGSQHWSNKAFLVRHLYAHRLALCPPTWSPACHGVPHLLRLLFMDQAYSSAKELLAFLDDRSSSSTPFAIEEPLRKLNRNMQVLLKEEVVPDEFNALLKYMLFNRSLQVEPLRDLILGIESKEPWRKYCGDQRLWILKPVGSSCGLDILLARGMQDTLRLVEEKFHYKCIVQKYIERPLLVRDRRKFDIRQWVLVTSINPLVVFGFSEFYLRLSTARYDLEDITAKHVHLCNHSVQKQYLNTSDHRDDNLCDSMMSQQEFLRYLDLLGHSSEHIKEFLNNVRQLCVLTIEAVKEKVYRVGRGFEWLGFDIMVTESLDTLLIEVNVSPDISPSTTVTSPLVDAAIRDLFDMIEDEAVLEKEPSCFQKRRDFTEYDPEASESSDLCWKLWHVGETLRPVDIQTIDISKRRVLELDSEYVAKDLDICAGILAAIRSLGNQSSCDDDDEL